MKNRTIKYTLLQRLKNIEDVIDLTNSKMEFAILNSCLEMKNYGVDAEYNLSVECLVEKQIGWWKNIEIKAIHIERIILFKDFDKQPRFTITKEDLKEFINY